jgi:hypothetical protein
MSKEFILVMATMPNFISFKTSTTKKGVSGSSIAVSELSEQEAREYAEEMRIAFINHWKNKSKNTKK